MFFKYASTCGEWGQYFAKCDDIADLKLHTSKHAYPEWDTAKMSLLAALSAKPIFILALYVGSSVSGPNTPGASHTCLV